MRKYAKEYRERLLGKLSRKKHGKKPSEVLDAEKVIAKYCKEQQELEPQLTRLESSDCPDSVCPECFYLYGLHINLNTFPGDIDVDRFLCPRCKALYENHS